tara:strand:+ start:18528 stop:19112 length:585 start_codon:yes stop_codon:yes gene_type:complete
MKKLTIYLVVAVVAISTAAFMNTTVKTLEANHSTDDFIAFLAETKSYTLELAEAMPADKYTFRPHDSIRSFGEQMAHIGMSSGFLLNLFIKGEPFPTDPNAFAEIGKMEKTMGLSKEECIKGITAAFEEIETTYKSMDEAALKETFTVAFDPEQPKFSKQKGFTFIKEHMIHHRGQALVALRMQGIKAPSYRLY